MKEILTILAILISLIVIGKYCESRKDPYEIGGHFDYTILCENGYIYKVLDQRQGVIQILNSDGTPLKCGETIY
jgi:hypothetical protein